VDAFVSAVLCRLAAFDALRFDAELNPPHGELADAVRGAGSSCFVAVGT
jgi:hypothetical protein